jgi:hypothetical protein
MTARLALALAVLGLTFTRGAADTETRTFTVHVDGKPSGTHELTLTTAQDGAVAVTAKVDVTVKVFLFTYKYSLRASEVWKDGRLQKLESTCDDNGTTYQVAAWVDGGRLRVRSNGGERAAHAETWTTTYWRQPAQERVNRTIPILDADTGRDVNSQLQYVGPARVMAAGQAVDSHHFRTSGQLQADLWYDGQQRLIRQESLEDGHRTTLELVRMTRK